MVGSIRGDLRKARETKITSKPIPLSKYGLKVDSVRNRGKGRQQRGRTKLLKSEQTVERSQVGDLVSRLPLGIDNLDGHSQLRCQLLQERVDEEGKEREGKERKGKERKGKEKKRKEKKRKEKKRKEKKRKEKKRKEKKRKMKVGQLRERNQT